MATGYYKLKSAAKFTFTLNAANHEVILASQGYEEKASALNGIESVRKHGTLEGNFDRRTSAAGEPYFVLKASNGQIIGTSEMYSSEAARDNGIASVGNNCLSMEVKEV
ncbi:YegP family protein [Luteolibacter marinus]|uniref:YegP family protein n=1 Tax=Luteolibacter marinus TaxID=2776705 RepID=UPI00186881B2|nr:YegP family protein [Luteolibacter marinus]